MKKKWFSLSNRILSGVLVFLGFQACGDSVLSNEEEYGCPVVGYQVRGKVTDMNGNPIKGIRVRLHDDQTIVEGQPVEETLTDDKGVYKTGKHQATFLHEGITVTFEDTDGMMNGGQFLPDTVPLKEMAVEQTEKRDGWYSGGFELTADGKLRQESPKDGQ